MNFKLFKKLIFVLCFVLILMLVGCAKNFNSDYIKGDSMYEADDGGTGYHSGEYTDYSRSDDMLAPTGDFEAMPGDVTGKDDKDGESNENEAPKPGQLTASAYFDNDYFDFWQGLLTSNQNGDGLFDGYYKKCSFDALNRVKITVPGIESVKVTIDGEGTMTDANGVCYLFPKENKDTYTAEFEYLNEEGILVKFTEDVTKDYTLDLEKLNKPLAKQEKIQLLFVIDTTGSMGDEIIYLKSEIKDVIEKVKKANDNVYIELGLIFYRDKGDEYVTKVFDFTTDIDKQVANLALQSAGGGGDFPEDITSAFKKANELQWMRAGTKILVHVADAPDHDEYLSNWNREVLALALKGVKIITIASSGIDKMTEYCYRSECLITNGCYGYLTNDSGIGGDHIEATTKEKMTVEYLNMMLVRLISGFYSGTFSDAIDWRQVQ